jgi:hypothetical protein
MPNVIENKLKSIKFTSKDMETAISAYSLEFPSIRRDDIEWQMTFPPFVSSLYTFIDEHSCIPTQNQYFKRYISDNYAHFKARNLSQNQLQALKARLYRSYPSFIRDLHFALYASESGNFEKVAYNEILDISYGIDLLVVYNKRFFAVNLYTNTQKAHFCRKLKQKRRNSRIHLNAIELPIEFSGSRLCGDFYLYGDRELSDLTQAIKEKCKIV